MNVATASNASRLRDRTVAPTAAHATADTTNYVMRRCGNRTSPRPTTTMKPAVRIAVLAPGSMRGSSMFGPVFTCSRRASAHQAGSASGDIPSTNVAIPVPGSAIQAESWVLLRRSVAEESVGWGRLGAPVSSGSVFEKSRLLFTASLRLSQLEVAATCLGYPLAQTNRGLARWECHDCSGHDARLFTLTGFSKIPLGEFQ